MHNAKIKARPHIVVQQTPMSQKLLSGTSGQQTVHVQLVPSNLQQQGTPVTSQQQHIIISSQPIRSTTPHSDSDGNPIATFMEYFVEQQQQPGCSSNIQSIHGIPQYRSPMNETK
jgi:type IV secretory pathway protease TraF